MCAVLGAGWPLGGRSEASGRREVRHRLLGEALGGRRVGHRPLGGRWVPDAVSECSIWAAVATSAEWSCGRRLSQGAGWARGGAGSPGRRLFDICKAGPRF